jgi:hypothetical protein
MHMSPEHVATQVLSSLAITKEDIVRAKVWLLEASDDRTDQLADEWLSAQQLSVPREVDTESSNCAELLVQIARAYSVRLAFYQAVWELVNAGELIPAEAPTRWRPSLGYRTSRAGGAIPLNHVGCSFPQRIEHPPFPSEVSADPDIFLRGVDWQTLHPGIREAIEQALGCFRRGLYMPATAMLAAAAEATWTESGIAIARTLTNAKLEGAMNDQLASISKKVAEIQKALEHPTGKALLKKAGQTINKVNDVEVWTTTLRDRRNALHWSKARTFTADHSCTAVLLMATPLHLGTLESIRVAC